MFTVEPRPEPSLGNTIHGFPQGFDSLISVGTSQVSRNHVGLDKVTLNEADHILGTDTIVAII